MTAFMLPPSFRIFYDDIDAEHERLIEVLNDLMACFVDGETVDFEPAFETFMAVMESHFANEEGHMRNLGYDGLAWHQAHHQDCLRRARALRDECRSQGHADLRILRECFDGVITDVARADLKFGEFIQGRGLTNQ